MRLSLLGLFGALTFAGCTTCPALPFHDVVNRDSLVSCRESLIKKGVVLNVGNNIWDGKEDYGTFQKRLHGDMTLCLKIAAEHGDADRQFFLATHYLRGNFGPKDIPLAIKWYTMAAEQGVWLAVEQVGMIYEDELGYQDLSKALFWYEVAARISPRPDTANRFAAHLAKQLPSAEVRRIKQRAAAWKPKPETSDVIALNLYAQKRM